MTIPSQSRRVHLIARPTGEAEVGLFEVVTVDTPTPGPGEVLVANEFISVDPYMFGRMFESPSYADYYGIGEPLAGAAVGYVVESQDPGFAVGDLVVSDLGWRQYACGPASAFTKVDPLPGVSNSVYLGALGTTGMTGYVGLLGAAEFKAGDVVFVSGAAGGVGTLVGQLAKLRGASLVIGSAGSDEKVEMLTSELGYDLAFNYKRTPPRKALRELLDGKGLDVYFDNVGGEHLEAALANMADHGRIALCGVISQYSDERPTGPRNLLLAIWKNLTLRGFLVFHYEHMADQFRTEISQAILDGKFVYRETVANGIDNSPQAFIDMLQGKSEGKMVVRVDS